MNAMLSDLKKNSENGAIAIGKTKVAVYDSTGAMRDMGSIYSELEEATKDMTDSQRDMALMNVFGEQSMRSVNTVLGQGSGKFKDLSKSIKESNGYAAEMENIMTDNLKGDIDGLSSAWEGFKIAIFDEGLGDFVRPLVQGLTDVIQKLPQFVTSFKNGLKVVKDFAFKGSGFFTKFKDTVNEKIEEFKPSFERLKGIVTEAIGVFTDIFNTMWGIVGPLLTSVIGLIGSVATTIFNLVMTIAVPLLALMWERFKMMWAIVGPVLELLGATISATFEVLRWVWDHVAEPFIGFLSGAFSLAIEGAGVVVGGLTGFFEGLGGMISWAADKFLQFKDWISSFKPPEWLTGIGGKVTGFFGFGGGADGSHADGAYEIPKDGYKGILHKGESVLTAKQSEVMRSTGMLQKDGGGRPKLNLSPVTTNNNSKSNSSFNLGNITVNVGGSNASPQDIERAVQRALNKAINEAAAVLG